MQLSDQSTGTGITLASPILRFELAVCCQKNNNSDCFPFKKIRNYMKKGLSVWLDVPLDALAKRISQVGTASRPLLDQPSDDPYTAVSIFILKTVTFQFFCIR